MNARNDHKTNDYFYFSCNKLTTNKSPRIWWIKCPSYYISCSQSLIRKKCQVKKFRWYVWNWHRVCDPVVWCGWSKRFFLRPYDRLFLLPHFLCEIHHHSFSSKKTITLDVYLFFFYAHWKKVCTHALNLRKTQDQSVKVLWYQQIISHINKGKEIAIWYANEWKWNLPVTIYCWLYESFLS